MQLGDSTPLDMGNTPTSTDDLVCVVCNDPLSYGGRGPRPKYCDDHKPNRAKGATTRRSGGTVDAAMASMEGLYSIVGMLLIPASPAASAMFSEAVPKAQAQNRLVFESDPALARSIAKGAAKGGKAVFVATNIMLIGPPLKLAMGSMQERSKAKPPKGAPKTAPTPSPAPSTGETMADQPPGPTVRFVDPVDAAIQRAKMRSV